MTRKSYDEERAAGLAALGRAVLQVIDELPGYPSDPEALEPVADDLRFAVRLTESLWSKLTDREPDQEWALQFLFDRQWRFLEPDKIDPASLGPDEVSF